MRGPFPLPVIGTVYYHLWYKDSRTTDLVNLKKFGKVVGEYFGTKPILVISDEKKVKEILVQNFNVFNQTQEPLFDIPGLKSGLTMLHGPEWKRIR